MISLINVKYFYKKRRVLNISKLKIEDNEKIAIMGLNGSGKTTLVELILGLKARYKGNFICDKQYIWNAVFQESSFNSDSSLKEIFYLYCKLYKVNKNHQEYFKEFQLTEVENNNFKKLSGGQQQKFKFLIALLNQPNFLVLDEISTSLDYEWRVKIIDIIHNYTSIHPEINVLLISHNPEEIAKICERVIVLKNGEIIQDIELVGTYQNKLKQIKGLVIKNV
ncbi:ATP-binding cassette domain-containing protein [Williamsoniiplasma lucivorax]|uniref:ABC transporter ATP-binding protein n=1 Tax=Williamsoniiplasma lucivorax TaxID=209274 RepID=A0A2S5RAF4_9MOLU|nr:ABC transporter ATP-binding protein [Williamsoniiplasma lucivorax]PPE04172.1 ABC transporter ATP-binding protein [Williamsoniiplasma lucivorax]